MGRVSFMAALIFFFGAAGLSAAPVHTAMDMTGTHSNSSEILRCQEEAVSVADEENVTGSILGPNEMIFLHDTVRQETGYQSRFISVGDRAFFLGNARLNAMDSLPEVFGYSNTGTFTSASWKSFPRGYENERCTGTSKEISKSEIMNTLKEGMHRVLKINPKYNPFLWKHLVRASLGKYSFGLDARIGSNMYVSPKITWSQNMAGWPLNTELKWVPVLRTNNTEHKGSYLMLKFGVKF